MSIKKKLLITGASGFLGRSIIEAAETLWDVYALYHRHKVSGSDVLKIQWDLADLKHFRELFKRIQPDAVIHAAALSQISLCEKHEEYSENLNVNASHFIATLCSEQQIPLAFTSTDLIFDGKKAPYSEESPVSPVNIYGRQKAMAEEKILKAYPSAAVCRLPLLVGYSKYHDNFTKTMIRCLSSGKSITLFRDEVRTPVDQESAARGILLSLNSVKGIIHLGGPQAFTRYELGLKFAEHLKIDHPNIRASTLKEAKLDQTRPANVSLNSQKAFDMGYAPLPLDDAIIKMVD